MPNLFQKFKSNFASSKNNQTSASTDSKQKQNISIVSVTKTEPEPQSRPKNPNYLLSLMIESDQCKSSADPGLFDPDEAVDEAETFNHITVSHKLYFYISKFNVFISS